MNSLILIGGGGHCKSVISIAEKCGFDILGIIDRPSELGNKVFDYQVIGNDDNIEKFVDKAVFHITVGFVKNADLRIKLFENVIKHRGKIVSIVSPNACVSKYSEIGEIIETILPPFLITFSKSLIRKSAFLTNPNVI